MDLSQNSKLVRPAFAHLAHNAAVGAVCGLLAIVQSIGFGTLLARGESAEISSAAIGMALFSTAVVAVLTPFVSSSRGVVAVAQGVPIAALGGIVVSIVAAMSGSSTQAMVATAVAAVSLSTMIIGAAALLLGRFNLGRFVRFVPFPVIGGFLAGSGWLILDGGLETLIGAPIGAEAIRVLAETDALWRLALGGVLVGLIALFHRLSSSRLVLPATIACTILLFDLSVWMAGIPVETLQAGRWLLPVGGYGALWPPLGAADIGLIDWRAIATQLVNVPGIAILTILALLMNATGIELDGRRDLDLDRELTAVGVTNLIAGLGGGLPGYHSVSLTVLASRLGAGDAIVGMTVAAFCIVAALFGRTVLTLVPAPILAGVLIWIGGGLIAEWLFRSSRRLSVPEYLVVALIFAVIVGAGFAWGIFVGLGAAAVLFVIEYGRVDIVRYTLTGRDYQTRTDTSEERRDLLHGHGDAILLLRLQGYLFFGTADRLRKRIQLRITQHVGAPIRFLVIDFQRVSGLDSSAVLSFVRLAQMAAPGGVSLVLTGMSKAVETAMLRGGLNHGNPEAARIEPSFDHGVEWCENALLAEVAPLLSARSSRPPRDILLDIVRDDGLAEALLPYFERSEVKRGAALITQGTPSDDIYFIESGRAAVELASGTRTIRLATVGHGAIVGEVAFYLAAPRSASVIAEDDVVAWRFSRASLDRLRAARPDVAARFHEGIAAMLSARLTGTNRLIQLLAD